MYECIQLICQHRLLAILSNPNMAKQETARDQMCQP